jgi:hypothetical protein
MKLDSRIIEGKTYLDCYDTEIAKKFIGKECYLSDGVTSFANIDNLNKATLMEVDDRDMRPYKLENNRWRYGTLFILPCEWVKPEEPEKKYRPYTLAEWIGQHTIGDVIRYRCKSQKIELRHLYVGYGYGIGTDIKNTTSGTLTLGVASYTLDYLLEDYEIEVNGEWLPFGIEVKE